MYRLGMRILIVWMIILFIPLTSFAGVDEDLINNLSKSSCIRSWEYDRSVFKIHFSSNNCKNQEGNAAILTVRYIFESNKAKFPKKIIINYGNGSVDSYPFANIPSLIKK